MRKKRSGIFITTKNTIALEKYADSAQVNYLLNGDKLMTYDPD